MRVKLKDITKFSKGTQINGKNLIDDGAYSYLNGGIKPSGKWNEFNVAENTVTISEGGNSSGYVNYMNEAFWCGAHCYYLYDGPKNSKYLYYALKSQQERLFRIRSGACMPNIKKSDLGNFIIEYEEDETRQEEVVKVLEKCELLIEDYNKKLALLDEAVRARFVEMFGDPRINEKKWKAGKIVDYFEVKGGKRIPKGMGYAERKTNHPYLRASDMKNATILDDDIHYIDEEVYKRIKRYTVNAHDIYLTNVGVNLGMAGVIPKQYDGANLTENAVKLVPKDKILLNGMFLSYYINSPGIQHYINERKMSVGVPKLAIFRIESMPLLLPPLELQNQFASFVEEVDKSQFVLHQ